MLVRPRWGWDWTCRVCCGCGLGCGRAGGVLGVIRLLLVKRDRPPADLAGAERPRPADCGAAAGMGWNRAVKGGTRSPGSARKGWARPRPYLSTPMLNGLGFRAGAVLIWAG